MPHFVEGGKKAKKRSNNQKFSPIKTLVQLFKPLNISEDIIKTIKRKLTHFADVYFYSIIHWYFSLSFDLFSGCGPCSTSGKFQAVQVKNSTSAKCKQASCKMDKGQTHLSKVQASMVCKMDKGQTLVRVRLNSSTKKNKDDRFAS